MAIVNMDEKEELLKIFSTMSFNGGNVKEAKFIDDNTIYLVMFNEPDMIFHFKSMSDWFLRTAPNYVKEIYNRGEEIIYESNQT